MNTISVKKLTRLFSPSCLAYWALPFFLALLSAFLLLPFGRPLLSAVVPCVYIRRDKRALFPCLGMLLGVWISAGATALTEPLLSVIFFSVLLVCFFPAPPLFLRCLLAGLCSLVSSLFVIESGFSWYNLLTDLIGAVLLGGFVFIVFRGLHALKRYSAGASLSDRPEVLGTIAFFLAGFSQWSSHFFFSPAAVLGMWLTLFAVYMLPAVEALWSAALIGAAVCCPTSLGIAGAVPFVAGALAMRPLLAKKRQYAVFGFCSTVVATCLVGRSSGLFLYTALPFAVCAFYLYPKERFFIHRRRLCEPPAQEVSGSPVHISDLQSLAELRGLFHRFPRPACAATPEELALTVSGVICSSCSRRLYCAAKPTEEQNVEKLYLHSSQGKKISVDLLADCLQKEQMLAVWGSARMLFQMQRAAENRMTELSEICALWAAQSETYLTGKAFYAEPVEDPALIASIKHLCVQKRVPLRSLRILKEEHSYLFYFRFESCGGPRLCSGIVPDMLYSLLRVPYVRIGYSDCHACGAWYRAKLPDTPTVRVRSLAAQPPDCGDTAASLTLPDGRLLVMLSDGCGVGTDASKRSRCLVDVMGRLLLGGFAPDAAIRLLNALTANEKGSFSTLDVLLFSPREHKLQWFKAGAAAGFIRHKDGSVQIITSSALPVGVVSEGFESWELSYQPQDLVICVSDGLLDMTSEADDKEQYLASRILEAPDTPEAAASFLLSSVYARAVKPADDITVIAVLT